MPASVTRSGQAPEGRSGPGSAPSGSSPPSSGLAAPLAAPIRSTPPAIMPASLLRPSITRRQPPGQGLRGPTERSTTSPPRPSPACRPAEPYRLSRPWQRVRTSNPLGTPVATVRLRAEMRAAYGTRRRRPVGSLPTSPRGIGLWSMVFKLATSAERHWRRQIIDGRRFRDGKPVHDAEETSRRLTPYPKIDHIPRLGRQCTREVSANSAAARSRASHRLREWKS